MTYHTQHDMYTDTTDSALAKAAERGDLRSVKGLLQDFKERIDRECKAESVSDDSEASSDDSDSDQEPQVTTERQRELKLTRFLNLARRWNEVEDKWGYDKSWEWNCDTPLLKAVRNAHVDVTQFLLVHGADPTLKSCITCDRHEDAASVVSHLLDVAGMGPKRTRYDLIDDMLTAAMRFWPEAPYNGSGSAREEFTNRPTNLPVLVAAVDAAVEGKEHETAEGDLAREREEERKREERKREEILIMEKRRRNEEMRSKVLERRAAKKRQSLTTEARGSVAKRQKASRSGNWRLWERR